MTVRPAFQALFAVLFLGTCCTVGCTAAAAQTPATKAGKPPVRVRTLVGGFELSPSAGKSPNQIGGASRDLGKPTLYAPTLGKSYSLQPQFFWSSGGTGDKVTFRLMAPTGEVVYETATNVEHLTYPADAPALVPGTTYKWIILPENDLLGGKPPVASIMIVGSVEREETAQELRNAVTAGNTAADIYIKHHDWYDAVQTYSNALKESPNDPNVLASRAMLYDELPVTAPLATADRAGIH